MPRFDWRDRENDRPTEPRRDRDDFGQADYSSDYAYDPRRRAGYRAEDDLPPREDYGQADYSQDYAYDPERRAAFRRDGETEQDYARRMNEGDYRRDGVRREGPRSWMDRAGSFLAGDRAVHDDRAPRRRGPSDRVLWAVIVERLKDERRLDLSDVDVAVVDAEVTLNGTVRRKEDKRRIEDIADIDGVRHVQNNLRVRDRGHWTFI
jgi:hypothetical protein